MFVLVLAAEADETRQAITFLIVCLVGIAALLSLLTVWYWRFTSPTRRQAELLAEAAARAAGDASPEPLVDEPDTSEPDTSEPDTSEPDTGEPDTGEPAVGEPAVGEPAVVGAAAGEPIVDTSELDGDVSAAPGSEAERPALVVPSGRSRIEVVERGTPLPDYGSAYHLQPAVDVEHPADPTGDLAAESADPALGVAAGMVSGPAADRHQTGHEPELRRRPVPVGAGSVSDRSGADRHGSNGDGLSDDAWAAVMKSAFDKLET